MANNPIGPFSEEARTRLLEAADKFLRPSQTIPATGDLVFLESRIAGPSHVQIAQSDLRVVPASVTRPVDEEAGVIRPPWPVNLSRVDSLDRLASQPDGTLIVWHSWTGSDYERQAGVLETDRRGGRKVRSISIRMYEHNTDLSEVDPPVWVVTFNDPGAGVDR